MALTDNLISYYKLDGNSNDAHASNNGTDTSISYDADWGIIGQGADFSHTGKSKIVVADHSSFNVTTGLTISFWMKIDSFADVVTVPIGKWQWQGGDGGNEYLAYLRNNGDFEFYARNTSETQYMAEAATAISLNTWYHIVCRWDSASANKLQVFVNTVVGGTSPAITGNMKQGTENIWIGNGSPVPDDRYTIDGKMDEIGFWSRALTTTEITALYNGGNGLAYPFNQEISKSDQLNIEEDINRLMESYIDKSVINKKTVKIF